MNDRFFLDTNIFVYSFDRTAPAKSRVAEELIRRAIATGKGIISYQVVQEFFNVALRHFAQPMSLGDAEQYLSITFRPLITVYPSVGLYGEALRLENKHSVSWYDALIAASAVEGQCSVLFSEDFQDGRKFGTLTVRNPFAGI
jgi:predicted nucleic acid-binding protein